MTVLNAANGNSYFPLHLHFLVVIRKEPANLLAAVLLSAIWYLDGFKA